MNITLQRIRIFARIALVTLLVSSLIISTVSVWAFFSNGREPLDAAGKTISHVTEGDAQANYEQFRNRRIRAQEIIIEAQLALEPPETKCFWQDIGWLPKPSEAYVPGALSRKTYPSYVFTIQRTLTDQDPTQHASRAETMRNYVAEKGWFVREYSDPDVFTIVAITEDNYVLRYQLKRYGVRSLRVLGGPFWGHYLPLTGAVGDRMVDELPLPIDEESNGVAGELDGFPKWSDPIIKRDIYGKAI